ncbi:AAA family ATPase [Desulfuromonas sp. KJ2020]|uniref:ATP-binding protein n=1 Tax=Desulfuromonas sp. KJ2020 TaxID=2919173 RepID=UPI0020A827DA|nr:AAA family ATPase [Desulfuromonas sp. KJ2020]MCP3175623.1 AAA family ATPase [Desulfuromonas sp. KJ2020]
MKKQSCQRLMERRAKRDSFLGTEDGLPLLEQFFTDLESAFVAARQNALARLEKNQNALSQSLDKAAEDLAKSREKLSTAFDETAQGQAGDDKTTKKLQSEIDAQMLWLYQRVRYQLDQALKPFTAKRRPVGQSLEQIYDGYQACIKKLPQEIVLIKPRQEDAEPLHGQSIFARQKTAFLERVCASSLAPLNRFLFWQARRQLQRRYRQIRLPAQQLARQHLPDRQQVSQHRLVKDYEAVFEKAKEKLGDSWRNLRFNLTAAIEELNELRIERQEDKEETLSAEDWQGKLAEIRKLVMEVLEQTAASLQEVDAPLVSFFEEFPAQLDLEHERLASFLYEDMLKARLWRARLRWEFHRRLLAIRSRFKRLSKELNLPADQQQAKGLLAQLRKKAAAVLPFLAVKQGAAQEELLRMADLPSKAELARQSQNLPPVYRRLFNTGPLRSREFLVGRDEEMETLSEVLNRWQEGRTCSVAITGPEGSGKTTLVNCFASEYGARHPLIRQVIGQRLRREEDVLALFAQWFEEAPPFVSLTDVVAYIRSREPFILLVEDGHNLLLRTIGGRQAAEAFLYVLLATRGHCLWLMTFRQYPFIRLDYQLRLGQYFTHQIPTLFHSSAEIRDMLLLRQHTTGYKLHFLPEKDKEVAEDASEEDLAAAQKERKEKYFRQMFEACGGNIHAALYYWQLSVHYDLESKEIRVCPLGRIDYRFVKSLDRLYLFSLSEVISHGGLSVGEHSEIFRLSPLRSQLTLDYLGQINLLDVAETEAEGLGRRYTINPIFVGPVSDILVSQNILY